MGTPKKGLVAKDSTRKPARLGEIPHPYLEIPEKKIRKRSVPFLKIQAPELGPSILKCAHLGNLGDENAKGGKRVTVSLRSFFGRNL